VALKLAHQDTCALLDLPCSQYDFFYGFKLGARDIVGGQSASAAAAYLLAKTLRPERVDPTIVITGSMTPGAIVGRVDGVEAKILQAQSNSFSSIFIPANTVCTNTPFCNGFQLNHQQCEISDALANGLTKQADNRQLQYTHKNTIKGVIACPRKRSIDQYAIDLEQCTLSRAPTQKSETKLDRKMTCNQSIGERDVRLSYDNCELKCNGSGRCHLQCSPPAVDGFIDVLRVTGIEQILENTNKETSNQPASIDLNKRQQHTQTQRELPDHMKLLEQLKETEISLAPSSILRAADSETIIEEKGNYIDLWLLRLLNKTGTEINVESFKASCEKTNQRIQLISLTLDRFRKARFTDKMALQRGLSIGDTNLQLCGLRGLILEAQLTVSVNFLDMQTIEKKNHIARFLHFVDGRIQSLVKSDSNPIMPFLLYHLARYKMEKGDLDTAYLLSNIAISFISFQRKVLSS
jgi:hypothetical protein